MSGHSQTLSASQVSDGLLCETKWALRRLLPKGPEQESARLGQAVHKLQERYLTDGTRQDVLPPECNLTDEDQIKFWRRAGNMALAGMPFIPGPGTGGVEGQFFATLGGIKYMGFLDWQGPAGVLPGLDAQTSGALPAALDHKTSSDPSKYGIWGKDAFLSDPQALIYACKLIVQHRADSVFLRWVYYWSKIKSRALPSDAVVTCAEVEDAFGAVVHPVAYRQVGLLAAMPAKLTERDVSDPEVRADLTGSHAVQWANSETRRNPDNCQKYGGCEFRPLDPGEAEELAKKGKAPGVYRGLCKLSASERARACMSGLNETKVVSSDRLSRKTKDEGVRVMITNGGAPDLFAKLQASANKSTTAAQPANTPTAAPAGAPVDLAAALKASSKAPPAAPKADPVNPPEKPAVTLPAMGADLQEHLKANGAEQHIRTEPKPKAEKRPSVRPSAMPTPATVEQSVAKLDSVIAEAKAGSNYRDGMAADFASRLATNLALDPDEIASRAYSIADAMLRERQG